MTKIITVTCLFFLVLYLRTAVCEGSSIDQKRKEESKKYYQLWFGPRIGRKKRNPSEDMWRNLDNSEVQSLANLIKKTPWTVILLPNGDNDGFRSDKEITGDSRNEQIEVSPRLSPYIPRLGRTAAMYQGLNKETDVF